MQAFLADGRVDVNAVGTVSLSTADLEIPAVLNSLFGQDGRSALQIACRYGHKSIVKSLLDSRNLEVNAQDSVCSCAVLNNFDHASDPHMKQNGCTALIVASQFGHTAVVQLLVAERKVKVNTQSTVSPQEGFSAFPHRDR